MEEALLLKLPEVLRRLAISRTAAYRLMARGDLPVVRIGRSIRFSARAVENLINEEKEEEAHA